MPFSIFNSWTSKSNKSMSEKSGLWLKQESGHDCGLACVRKILFDQIQLRNSKTAGEESSTAQLPTLQDLGRDVKTNSIWTIDLCYLLNTRNVNFTFFTRSAGVCEQYADFNYYCGSFDDDQKRVSALFSRAKAQGIHITESSLSVDEILTHLAQGPHAVALVLVDASFLAYEKSGRVAPNPDQHDPTSYRGHYILVSSYLHRNYGDSDQQTVFFRVWDPSPRCADKLLLHSDLFEQARKASGTDEDIILINM